MGFAESMGNRYTHVKRKAACWVTIWTEMNQAVYHLVNLYPQTAQGQPAVENIPLPNPSRPVAPEHKINPRREPHERITASS